MLELDWIHLGVFLIVLTLLTKPLGIYIYKVLQPEEKIRLCFFLRPLELVTYRILGVKVEDEQNWKEYLYSVLIFSCIALVVTFLLLAIQQILPLNPEKLGALSAHLNFNTSSSFMTNTNWQSYGGETTMSYFSQMVPLTLQNFLSPAVGLAVAATLGRAIRRDQKEGLGSFWVDLVRITYYVLLPLACILAILLVSQGVPQNFNPYIRGTSLESKKTQVIVQGPIASQEAIKILGTNGGGYTNANSSHPYENPTPLANFLETLSILLIPAAQTYYYGRQVKNQKHGWCLYIVMVFFFVLGLIVCNTSERSGNPLFATLGASGIEGNMEGKEVRFGIMGSTLFTTATTTASNGAVNSMLDSYTPFGGLIPLLAIQLGEIIWGGIGSGLYSILIFAILTVFSAGLIIGRTPEYLGKKIESLEIKLSTFPLLAFILVILGFTAWASVSLWGLSSLGNKGPHGFTEILYAYSSTTGNNGSAFAGLSANNPWWNITLGIAMILGRFMFVVPVLALAGSLVKKQRHPETPASFPVAGGIFTVLLIGVIVLVGVLCFLPALVMGPFIEDSYMKVLKVF